MSGRRLFAGRLLPLLPLHLGGERSHAEKLQVASSGAILSMPEAEFDDEFTDVVPEETLVEIEEGQDAARKLQLAPGSCYYKQKTAGSNGRCPVSAQWVLDTWGRDHANSDASEANCMGRREGHDNYCGAAGGSRWRFVRSKGKAQQPPPTQPGCYFKQYFRRPAAPGRCTEIQDWTLDSWGIQNLKPPSDESEANCEARKQGHDSHCGSTVSQWLYVPRPAASGKRNSVLIIGNSMTFTIFHVLQDAFTQGRTGLSFQTITTGGRKMDDHKNALFQEGEWHYKNMLSAKKWKYVVLQEAGYMPWRHSYKSRTFDTSLKAVLWWDKEIQELGAETVVYEPIPRRDGTLNMKSAQKRKLGFEAFYRATKKGVDKYIKSLKKQGRPQGRKPKLAAVGTAFMLAHIQNKRLWGDLYDHDGIHPSPRGQYLASCVLFGTISGKSPKSLPLPEMASSYKHYANWETNVLKPAEISSKDGATLRKIAHKAVFGCGGKLPTSRHFLRFCQGPVVAESPAAKKELPPPADEILQL